MHTAVATSLTPSESVASTDTTDRPRLALVLAHGAEHVPRICAASHAALDPYGRLDAGHVRERAFSDVSPRMRLTAAIRPIAAAACDRLGCLANELLLGLKGSRRRSRGALGHPVESRVGPADR
jgi:hypothetical protein